MKVRVIHLDIRNAFKPISNSNRQAGFNPQCIFNILHKAAVFGVLFVVFKGGGGGGQRGGIHASAMAKFFLQTEIG